jgi:hypothetical protein
MAELPRRSDVHTLAELDLLDTAAELNARIAACHDEVACPYCGSAIGERCVRMLRAKPPVPAPGRRPVKYPHRQRWTQVVAAR